MELRELRYFAQIANAHSYTKAAENLYISQPALSKAIKKLESEFQVPLLYTNSAGVFMTDYGKLLYEKATPLIAEFDSLPGIIRDAREGAAGELFIGVTPMINTLYFEKILEDFSNEHPQINFRIIEGGSKLIKQFLQEGTLDFGLCITGDTYPSLSETILLQDYMVVCLPDSNPLSQKSFLTFQDLQKEAFIVYSKASSLYTQILDYCLKAGYNPKICFSSSRIESIIQKMEKGSGIAILPRLYAEFISTEKFRLVPIRPIYPWCACLVRRKASYQSKTSQLFAQYIIDCFGTQ